MAENQKLLIWNDEKNSKALLFNGTSINLFKTENNYKTGIVSVTEKDDGFDLKLEHSVFYHSKTADGEEQTQTVKKNNITVSVKWYSEADIFDYMLQDSKLVKTSVIDGYASSFYATHEYQKAPIWSAFFDETVDRKSVV